MSHSSSSLFDRARAFEWRRKSLSVITLMIDHNMFRNDPLTPQLFELVRDDKKWLVTVETMDKFINQGDTSDCRFPC